MLLVSTFRRTLDFRTSLAPCCPSTLLAFVGPFAPSGSFTLFAFIRSLTSLALAALIADESICFLHMIVLWLLWSVVDGLDPCNIDNHILLCMEIQVRVMSICRFPR